MLYDTILTNFGIQLIDHKIPKTVSGIHGEEFAELWKLR